MHVAHEPSVPTSLPGSTKTQCITVGPLIASLGRSARLVTVGGVNVVCAATFLAAAVDIRRFRIYRQLVAHLGLDSKGPPVRMRGHAAGADLQAGVAGNAVGGGRGDPRHDSAARAAASVRSADPRSPRLADRTVAAAGKLAWLFWSVLTRDENYDRAQQSLTAKRLRKLELIVGVERFDGSATGIWAAHRAVREAENRLASV